MGLGDLPNGSNESYVTDISADGSVVVGNSNWPFRWTRESGMVALPIALGQARAITSDGNMIIGSKYGYFELDEPNLKSWSEDNGVVDLYAATAWNNGFTAYDVSADGGVIVGGDNIFATGPHAFHWTPVGLSYLNGSLEWGVASHASAVSDDGSIVVVSSYGSATRPEVESRSHLWTESTGLVDLGLASGFNGQSEAVDITPDGKFITGWKTTDSEPGNYPWATELYRWSEETGMVGLADLPGGFSRPTAISANGNTIVGFFYYFYHESIYNWVTVRETFIWTPSGGIENLHEKLMASGVTGLDDWQLTEATAISADGRTIVGNGINPSGQYEAWIATIGVPEPSSLFLVSMAIAGLCTSRNRFLPLA